MKSYFKILLLPLAILYWLVLSIRNMLFDFKILRSEEFKLPVISVGNITVGGTGKTPHTEYLIRLLKDQYKIAFLSRGYKRKTRDFLVATDQSTADMIGDEPMQIKRKFPEIMVAVDRKRREGIHKLMENIPNLDIVLLDDAYQHRSVDPGINILLIDFTRPIKGDWLLPYGRLRESASEKKRADIIIVSKAPRTLLVMEKRLFQYEINPLSHQSVYFTTIAYGDPMPVFVDPATISSEKFKKKNSSVLLVTGIADPSSLIEKISSIYQTVTTLTFPDHHSFSKEDIAKIMAAFHSMEGSETVIFTTEKDAARLQSFADEKDIFPESWFYIPIRMEFLFNEEEHFNHQIIHYVKNNSRNSILYKK
jgi:tetraacyldisaccharide 4'-kinase